MITLNAIFTLEKDKEQKKTENTSKVLEGSSLLIFVKNLTKELLVFGRDLLETSETMLVFLFTFKPDTNCLIGCKLDSSTRAADTEFQNCPEFSKP